MNFTQMHDHLRAELLRRIERGTLSVALLARQTGFGQSHLSNFLHHRGHLSLEAMDRILSAQHMAAGDLLPSRRATAESHANGDFTAIPVVAHSVALFEPFIRPSVVQEYLHLPAGSLGSLGSRATAARRKWERFVSVRIPADDAPPMQPLVWPETLAVLDRHYNSLTPYRDNRPTLYAVRNGSRLVLRYLDFQAGRLILRPHNLASPVELLETEPGESPNDLVAGRVAFTLNEV